MAVKRTIYLLSKGLDVVIDYTHGTTLTPFQFAVADYDLTDASVTAYSTGASKELKKIVCEVKGNVIEFAPKAGYFELGDNGLQLRITRDEKDLFSFMCLVRCHDAYDLDADDAAEVEDNPTLLAQLLSQMGQKASNAEVEQKIKKCHDELSGDINVCRKELLDEIDKERAEIDVAINDEKLARDIAVKSEEEARKAEVAVERARIDKFTALKAGSTTGDAELMDARVDHTGKTHKNLGEHVRKVTGKLDEEKLGYKGYIDTAIDYDELVNVGIYNILNESVDGSVNYPSVIGGLITVTRRTGYDAPVVQDLVDNSGTFYTRYKTIAGGWTEWTEYVSKREYDEHVDNSLCYKTYIDYVVDFNELITPGVYNILSPITAGSLNYPSKLGGMMTIKRRIGYDYPVSQELTDTDGVLYIRYKTSLGWSDWKEYVTKDVFDAHKKDYEELKAVETHTDGVGALVEIAETYFDVAYDPNDQLLYNTKRGLFAENPKDDNGIKSIVCSQFAQACIGAIEYQHSRYVKDSNDALPWGFVSDGSGVYAYTDWNEYNDYMTACEQARYFEAHGMLNTFDVNRNRLKPGDLLFYTSDSVDEDIYYRKITHVAICLGVTKGRHTIMHSNDNRARLFDGKEAGVMVDTYYYDRYAPAYFVRSPISVEYASRLVASKTLRKSGDYTGNVSAYIDKLMFDEPLEQGFYTLNFDDAGDSYGYIKVYYENGTSANYEGGKAAGVNNIVFYAEMPITQIDIRVALGTTYSCSWAKLYRGYHN